MFNDFHEQQANYSQGLLRPGRFFWARAVSWGIVLGMVLWIAYKFVKGVGIDSGLDGSSGVPTLLGVLAALALYVLSVRLIERRTQDELGLAQLAPELAELYRERSIPRSRATERDSAMRWNKILYRACRCLRRAIWAMVK